jgi:small subunit ribosomal protein S11e
MENDTGRSYHKQAQISIVRNKLNKSKVTNKSGVARQVKSIGLGIKTPKDAKTMDYVDKKCPFTGGVSIRGRILVGKVTKIKMNRTLCIRRDYLHYIKKYNRFEKRHKMLSAHVSPCFRDVAPGDQVTVGECRPLAKTVKFNVIKVDTGASGKKGFDKF